MTSHFLFNWAIYTCLSVRLYACILAKYKEVLFYFKLFGARIYMTTFSKLLSNHSVFVSHRSSKRECHMSFITSDRRRLSYKQEKCVVYYLRVNSMTFPPTQRFRDLVFEYFPYYFRYVLLLTRRKI